MSEESHAYWKEMAEVVRRIEAEMARLAPLFPHLTARQLKYLAADSLDAERERPQ